MPKWSLDARSASGPRSTALRQGTDDGIATAVRPNHKFIGATMEYLPEEHKVSGLSSRFKANMDSQARDRRSPLSAFASGHFTRGMKLPMSRLPKKSCL